MKISFLFIPNELTHVRLDDSKFQYINYFVQSDYYLEICNILQNQLCEREVPPTKNEIMNMLNDIFSKTNRKICGYDFNSLDNVLNNMLNDEDMLLGKFECTIEIQ